MTEQLNGHAPYELALPPPVPPGEALVDPATHAASLSTTINPRLAPQDLDAERSVLGGVLLTNDAIHDISLKPEEFYREPHRRIWQAMLDLAAVNQPIDVITLGDWLKKGGHLEFVGGPAYLGALDATVPATANLARYEKIVHDKFLARQLIQTAHAIARDGYDQKGEVSELLDSAERRVMEVGDLGRSGAEISGAVLIDHDLDEIARELMTGPAADAIGPGLMTGLEQFDLITLGLQSDDFIVIGARPSMGKSALARSILRRVCVDNDKGGLLFTIEVRRKKFTLGLVSSLSGVPYKSLRARRVDDGDWDALAPTFDRLKRAPLHVDEGTPDLTHVRRESRKVKRRLEARGKRLEIVIIDYLQLMRTYEAESREQEIAQISRGLKRLAKELGCPVIALSQLNRSLEKRDDKRPQMSDLRESGAIEQDADVIVFVYRDEVYHPNTAEKGVAELIIGKARDGEIGAVKARFDAVHVQFENLPGEPRAAHQMDLGPEPPPWDGPEGQR